MRRKNSRAANAPQPIIVDLSDPLYLPPAIEPDPLDLGPTLAEINGRPRRRLPRDEKALGRLLRGFSDPVTHSNLFVALAAAEAGAYIFPVSADKVPEIRCWTQADHEVTADDRRRADERARRKNPNARRSPHYGATRNPETLRALWRRFPDALPAISLGPSGLAVVDADAKHDGPARLERFAKKHGGIGFAHPVTDTQSGGIHVYFSNPKGLGCTSAGPIKKELGSDFKAAGGQVLAPGAKSRDGKVYTPNARHANLFEALITGSIPALPKYIRDVLGTTDEQRTQNVKAIYDQHDPLWLPGVITEKTRAALGYLKGHEDFEGYAAWLDVGMILHHQSRGSDEGRELWDEWSEALDNYDSDEIDAKWISFGRPGNNNNKIKTEATLYRLAKERGWQGHTVDGGTFGVVQDNADNEDEPTAPPADEWKERSILEIGQTGYQPVDYIRKNLVVANTVGVWWGKPGAGKTKLAVNEGLRFAYGLDDDPDVIKGGVLFVALETPDDTRNIALAWVKHNAEAGRINPNHNAPFVLMPDGGSLYNSKAPDKATTLEKRIIARAQRFEEQFGVPCRWIIVDTYARAVHPGEENSNDAATSVTKSAERIAAAVGAGVTFLAHPDASGTKVRGATAVSGNFHSVVKIGAKKEGSGTYIIVDKLKGTKPGTLCRLVFREVEVGTLRSGAPALVAFACRSDEPTAGGQYAVSEAEQDAEPEAEPKEDAEDGEAPVVPTVADKQADRPQQVLEAAGRVVDRLRSTGEARTDIRLNRDEWSAEWNGWRKQQGLKPLQRTAFAEAVDELVTAGRIVQRGKTRNRFYTLAAKTG